MKKRGEGSRANESRIARILSSFSTPKTPQQVVRELEIKRFKLKPFLEKGLVVCLNPSATKGRLYLTTENAELYHYPSKSDSDYEMDWELIGWIIASPYQRLPVLRATDGVKRVSEDIRRRASRWNCHLSRTSTKEILKELIYKQLIETEMMRNRRYYWINDKGKVVVDYLISTYL
ncbi:MAG: hypothetical protein JRJ66_02800 [Deltaproteobacteria bacterium]|nr:hypothetical protein [Deltaproteobacteria bacterium]